ncbi:hypothetical protein [Salmonella phage ZCSE8]|nr:hypothetical protein [Salmonella phage ZCSE8]
MAIATDFQTKETLKTEMRNHIKTLMKEKNIKQGDLAHLTGRSQPQISKMLSVFDSSTKIDSLISLLLELDGVFTARVGSVYDHKRIKYRIDTDDV